MKSLYKEKNIWKFKRPFSISSRLAREMDISPLQALLMANRGVSDPDQAREFLSPRLSSLADPMLLKGMKEGVETILGVLDSGDKITVYGDYDADGITATALLVRFFSEIGRPVSYYIPHRVKEGYGMNREAVEKIASKGTRLIITVDCGTSDLAEICLAQSLGLKVVVTDHHRIPEDFAPKCPYINPSRVGCSFPCKYLAGVGLAFYLVVAIRAGLRKKGWFLNREEPDLKALLDLVAIGTVADCVPLNGQNRLLVASGLRVMGRSRWSGIEAVKSASNINAFPIRSEDVAFRIAPRLNAPGRIGDPGLVMELLLSDRQDNSTMLASRVDAANRERRIIEEVIIKQIDKLIEAGENRIDGGAIVASAERWHRGVLGIVASRLVQRFNRPAFVFCLENGLAVGSARSIPCIDLYGALYPLRHLFKGFGGHAGAVGVSMKQENLIRFEKEINEIISTRMDEESYIPVIEIDSEIDVENLDFETIFQIRELEPFGEGNPQPLFLSRRLVVKDSRTVGENHLKLLVKKGTSTLDAIGFDMAGSDLSKGEMIDMVFSPQINRWKGNERIQLKMADFRRSEP